MLPFAPLMQPPAAQAETAWLEQCVAKARDMPLAPSVKADVLTGLTLLSGLVYNPQTVTTIVSKEHLMDLMRESPFGQYLTQQAREEGIEQGERKHAIESLLEVVELRFGADAAESLAAPIRALDDVPRLNQLLRTAIQASSFEEFRTVFLG